MSHLCGIDIARSLPDWGLRSAPAAIPLPPEDQAGPPAVSMTTYTFGAPRTGNTAFAKEYGHYMPDCWSIINGQDVGECGCCCCCRLGVDHFVLWPCCWARLSRVALAGCALSSTALCWAPARAKPWRLTSAPARSQTPSRTSSLCSEQCRCAVLRLLFPLLCPLQWPTRPSSWCCSSAQACPCC
jgi:hypothetical protein